MDLNDKDLMGNGPRFIPRCSEKAPEYTLKVVLTHFGFFKSQNPQGSSKGTHRIHFLVLESDNPTVKVDSERAAVFDTASKNDTRAQMEQRRLRAFCAALEEKEAEDEEFDANKVLADLAENAKNDGAGFMENPIEIQIEARINAKEFTDYEYTLAE